MKTEVKLYRKVFVVTIPSGGFPDRVDKFYSEDELSEFLNIFSDRTYYIDIEYQYFDTFDLSNYKMKIFNKI